MKKKVIDDDWWPVVAAALPLAAYSVSQRRAESMFPPLNRPKETATATTQ